MNKLQRLYQNQSLTQDNFNEIINTLQGTTEANITVSGNNVNITSGTFADSSVVFTYDTNGLTKEMLVKMVETVNYAPLYTSDYIDYKVPGLFNINPAKGVVVRIGDTAVNPSLYQVIDNYIIRFTSARNPNDVYTITCTFTKEAKYTLSRGADNEPLNINIVPGGVF